ncbi:MAG: hypothetical protein L0Y58_13710 [Verrucomicrobia subdivision 3 bacterium]|nr:hypothetical protein [Limisphaerales bacterium]
MNDEVYQDLLEASWRRKLTAEEDSQLRAYLAAHPELQVDAEEEAWLTRQLHKLPDAPLASNFTAQVWRQLDLESAREGRRRRWQLPQWWRRWMPRCASALLVAILAGTGAFQYRKYRQDQRHELARNVLRVAPIAGVPQPEIYKDFDAIRELPHVHAVSDAELLAALQ